MNVARHDEQVRFLDRDLSRDFSEAARHPIFEPHPLGRHRESPNTRAISNHGDSELFDITICHPLERMTNGKSEITPARIQDYVQKPAHHPQSCIVSEIFKACTCFGDIQYNDTLYS